MLEHRVRKPPWTVRYSKKGALVEGVMFMLSNVMVLPICKSIVGSKVIVKDPITGSTGAAGKGVPLEFEKPLAVKLMVSVIVVAFAGLSAPVAASANADANATKVLLFLGMLP